MRSLLPAVLVSVVPSIAGLSAQSLRDCLPSVVDSIPCRVADWSPPAEEARANRAKGAWARGDTLVFIAASPDSAEILGGISGPMSRVAGTDLWHLSVRVAGLDRAQIGYRVLTASTIGLPPRSAWRGAALPAPPPRAQRLQGTIRVDTLDFAATGAGREVISYVPAGYATSANRYVIYMGDGATARALAPMLDTLIATGVLPATAIIGVRSAPRMPTQPESIYDRGREYVHGFRGDTSRFAAHEKFFLETVISWAEKTVGAPAEGRRRLLWGASNSGGFAITIARRHPSLFRAVLANSPVFNALVDQAAGPSPDFCLMAGSFEPIVERAARATAEALRKSGGRVEYQQYVGGHDDLAWEDAFIRQFRWAIDR